MRSENNEIFRISLQNCTINKSAKNFESEWLNSKKKKNSETVLHKGVELKRKCYEFCYMNMNA